MDNCSTMCGKLLLTLMEQILPGESPDLKEVVNPVSSLSYVLSVTTACLSQQVQAVIQLLPQGSDDYCHYHYAVSTGGKYGIITVTSSSIFPLFIVSDGLVNIFLVFLSLFYFLLFHQRLKALFFQPDPSSS